MPSQSSPLLCPRRTLIASLILAAKFFQDRAYSTRAWSNLIGLPAREVARSERALLALLGWRLWPDKESEATQAIADLDMRPVVAIDAVFVAGVGERKVQSLSDATISSLLELAHVAFLDIRAPPSA